MKNLFKTLAENGFYNEREDMRNAINKDGKTITDFCIENGFKKSERTDNKNRVWVELTDGETTIVHRKDGDLDPDFGDAIKLSVYTIK